MLSTDSLDSLFNAQSIAIVGVSSDESKIGSVIYKNLLDAGYQGKIFQVNPKYQELRGLPCYPTVSAIPEEVDLACISIPAAFVKDSVVDIVNKKVKSAVIISAGFGEIGEQGHQLENEITTLLQQANIRLLGPNCLGFMRTSNNLNLSFAAEFAHRGDIALFSQSGAICTALLDRAASDGLGFSHVVSVGNKSDIGELDLTSYFVNNPEVKVLGAYLESMKLGRSVIKEYLSTETGKPFVMIKPGISDQAKSAIGSHTGAIAGSAKAFETAMSQAGIMQVTSIDEFYSLLQCFSWMKPVLGERIAIVTNAGGPGIIATDEVVGQGLSLAQLSEETIAQLKEILPAESNIKNPVDLLGDARTDRYEKAVTAVAADSNVDAILVLMTPQFVTEIEQTAASLSTLANTLSKPIIPVMLGGDRMNAGIKKLSEQKVVSFTEITEAVKRVKQLSAYYQTVPETTTVESIIGASVKTITLPEVTVPSILDTETTENLLRSVGVTMASQKICDSLEEAYLWAEDRYPVVLKIPNEILVHKTEQRGVVVNIKDEDSLRQAWYELAATEKSITQKEETSLLIQQQIKFEEELFIGANRDGNSQVYESDQPGFGHLLVFGKGGIYTELYKDYGYAMLPASDETLLRSLSKTKISFIMTGLRNKKPLAVAKFVQMLKDVQHLLILYPEIVSVDFNPVLLTTDEAYAVDTKIFIG